MYILQIFSFCALSVTLGEAPKVIAENQTEADGIGIIICRSKNRTVVEYALKSVNAPIGVATYQIQNEVPASMKKLLPEPEEIARRLDELENL